MIIRLEIAAVVAVAPITLIALWSGVLDGAAPRRDLLALAVLATALQAALAVLVLRQTARRKAGEDAAQTSRARYQAIFDTAQDAIISIDDTGRVEAFNHGAERIFGYSADEMLGRPVETLMPADIAVRHVGILRERIARGHGRLIGHPEVDGQRKDGSLVPLELSIGSWVAADGRHRFTGVLRDVSDRQQNERELRQAIEQAETANRTKSAFLANMSHELRTPLNAIIGFAEALETRYFGPLTAKQEDYIRDIQASGRHLLALIGDILDISKIEAGRVELCDERIDVGHLIDACLQLAWPRAQSGSVALSRQVPNRLPAVRADMVRLKQIVLNLLVNAIKFTPPGGRVTVSAALDAGGLVLSIADTGIGMTPEELQIALQPFRQIDSPLSKRFEGTGLGLPLARSLIELHGGRLVIDSRKGVGTVATIQLPAERMVPRAEEAA